MSEALYPLGTPIADMEDRTNKDLDLLIFLNGLWLELKNGLRLNSKLLEEKTKRRFGEENLEFRLHQIAREAHLADYTRHMYARNELLLIDMLASAAEEAVQYPSIFSQNYLAEFRDFKAKLNTIFNQD